MACALGTFLLSLHVKKDYSGISGGCGGFTLSAKLLKRFSCSHKTLYILTRIVISHDGRWEQAYQHILAVCRALTG